MTPLEIRMTQYNDSPAHAVEKKAGRSECFGTSGRLYVHLDKSDRVFVYDPTSWITVKELTAAKKITDIRGQLKRTGQVVGRRPLTQIQMLAIHWDGGPIIPLGYSPKTYYNYEAMYHISKDWGDGSHGDGIMYHWKISRDGTIWWTRDLEDMVWAVTRANTVAVSACVDATVGQPPTAAQKDSVRWLANELFTNRPDLPNLTAGHIWGHGELTDYGNSTSCPGPDLLSLVKTLRV